MRPRPLAAGFQRCRPGSVWRSAKLGSSAIASRDILRAMPLAVTDVTNSRREILIVPRLSPPEPEHRPDFQESTRLPNVATSRKIGERLGARAGRDQRRPLARAERNLRRQGDGDLALGSLVDDRLARIAA